MVFITAILASLKNNIKPIALYLIVAGVIFYAYYSVTGLIKENAALRGDLDTARSAAARMAGDLQAGRAALKAREAAIARLIQEKNNAIIELEKLYQEDAEAGDWAGGLVPLGVFQRLRE